MLDDQLREAKNDRPVWLADVREALAACPDAARIVLRLALWDGVVRDWPLALPRWRDTDGTRFAAEYLRANVFNILSACSGRCLTVYHDPEDGQTTALVSLLPVMFQRDAARRTGCGKAVTVADRISRAFGQGPFRFETRPLSDWSPLPPESAPAQKDGPGPRLRRAAVLAGRGLCCGVDIGGTDIKLVLARDGHLVLTRVLDWDPSRSPDGEGITGPILSLIRQAVDDAAPGALLDGLGVSFPDVVIRDVIVGGETPKTRGMRENPALDYDSAFARLGRLREALLTLCRPGAPVHLTNDGHMAAFAAALELAYSGQDGRIAGGVMAHSLGTDLGTGWLLPDGSIPEIPLEAYDFLLDLGSWPSRERPAEDLRSVCNENSGLPGARRYLGQSAAFRLAWELCPALLDGFTQREGDVLSIRSEPDMRKPCLERLMDAASRGEPGAEQIFRLIGSHLGQVCREIDWLLHPATDTRFLFGRFAKHPACFALLRDGCAGTAPRIALENAADALAYTPLMADLARRGPADMAQYAQAAGAVFFPFAAD